MAQKTDNTSEHYVGNPIQNKKLQDLIDQAQITGGGVAHFPRKNEPPYPAREEK